MIDSWVIVMDSGRRRITIIVALHCALDRSSRCR